MTANYFDWNHELPPETEGEVYRSLLRALRRKQGFGLFFVQCTPAQGGKIIADLRRDLPQQQIQKLHLEREVVTLFDQVDDLWKQQPFDVLVVEGLEASLYAYEKPKWGLSNNDIYNYGWKGVPKILNHLNWQREHFQNCFSSRFVFLVPRFVVDYFVQRAADFLDWRSGLFRFPDPEVAGQDDEKIVVKGDNDEYPTLSPKKRFKKIIESKKLLENCPNPERKIELLSELGLLFDADQDYKNALTSYDKALEIKPNLYEAWNNRGNALSALNRYEEAIASYDKALEIKPDYHEAWYKRGVALSALGRIEEAIASFDKSLEFKPNYSQSHKVLDFNSDDKTWYNRGYELDELGRYEEAIASFDKSLEFSPEDPATFYNRGVVLSELGRYQEAISSYEKSLEFNPNLHEAWNNRGNALYALKRYEEAIASYNKALEFKPDKHEAWYNRGVALSALGRKEDAIVNYGKALEIKPDKYEAWNNRGMALSALGRYEEAIANYDNALKIKPDYHEAWNNRGVTLSALGWYEDAIASYDKALVFTPNFPEASFNRGVSLSALGRYEEAIASYDKALEYKSDYHAARINRGISLSALERYEEAIETYEKALAFEPNAQVFYNKACCYALQGKVNLALQSLKQSLNLDLEKYCELAKNDSDFDAVRDDARFQAMIGE